MTSENEDRTQEVSSTSQASDSAKDLTKDEKEKNKSKIFSITNIILLLLLLLVIYIHYSAVKNPNFGEELMDKIFEGDYLESPIWVALGLTMLACFLGALIPIPVPYMLSVGTYSWYWIIESSPPKWWAVILIVLLAAIANTLGDSLDYVIGVGTEKATSKDDPEMSSRWGNLILKYPKLIPWIIALFAVTPAPDSMLMVPLGIVKYPPKKTLSYMFIGKIIMMLFSAITGIFAFEWFKNTFGASEGFVLELIFLYSLWVIIVIMLKYKPKTKDNKEDDKNPPTIEDYSEKLDKQFENWSDDKSSKD